MERYDPWRAIEQVGPVTIVDDDLPPGRRGEIHFNSKVITLSRELLQVERTCTLAHELVHLERGPVIRRNIAREERTVASIAARRLVRLEDLADALSWSTDCAEIAHELGVDTRTVRVRLASLTEAERQTLASLHTPAEST